MTIVNKLAPNSAHHYFNRIGLLTAVSALFLITAKAIAYDHLFAPTANPQETLDLSDHQVVRMVDLSHRNTIADHPIQEALYDGRVVLDSQGKVESFQRRRVVYIPGGEYTLTEPLVLFEGTTLLGSNDPENRTKLIIRKGNDSSNFSETNGPPISSLFPSECPAAREGNIQPVITTAMGYNGPIEHSSYPYSGINDPNVVTGYNYFSNHFKNDIEQSDLGTVMIDGEEKTLKYAAIHSSVNNTFGVHLKNIDIVIESGNPSAVGVLWRTAQESSIEGVRVFGSGGEDAPKAGILFEGNGGGTTVLSSSTAVTTIEGVEIGMGGQGTTFSVIHAEISDTTGPAVLWTGNQQGINMESLHIQNCAEGIILDRCHGQITVANSNIDFNGSGETSAITQLVHTHTSDPEYAKQFPDGLGFANLRLHNVGSDAPFLVSQDTSQNGIKSTSGSNYPKHLIPSDGNRTHASSWNSGLVLSNENSYFEEELPSHWKTPHYPEIKFPVPSPKAKNVADPLYGAVGNRSADDSDAIQAAIDDSSENGNGEVIIPHGVYSCNKALVLKDNTKLFGIGYPVIELNSKNDSVQSIYSDPDSPKPFLSSGSTSDIVLSHLIIHADAQSDGRTNPNYFYTNNESLSGAIGFEWGGRARIVNSRFSGGTFHTAIKLTENASGIMVSSYSGGGERNSKYGLHGENANGPVYFYNVYLEHYLKRGILLENCKDFTARGIGFEDTGYTSAGNHVDSPYSVEILNCNDIELSQIAAVLWERQEFAKTPAIHVVNSERIDIGTGWTVGYPYLVKAQNSNHRWKHAVTNSIIDYNYTNENTIAPQQGLCLPPLYIGETPTDPEL